jgi:hypothetical protein
MVLATGDFPAKNTVNLNIWSWPTLTLTMPRSTSGSDEWDNQSYCHIGMTQVVKKKGCQQENYIK